MDILVSKFGGSSVATPEKLRTIQDILKQDNRRRCVVLSAPGKGGTFTVKVTDMLIELTKRTLNGEDTGSLLEEIRHRFHLLYTPLGVSEEEIAATCTLLDEKLNSPRDDPRKFRDLIVASGEEFNARLFPLYLQKTGIDAVLVSPQEAGLRVTEQFGDAQPLPEVGLKLASLKKICGNSVVIFPGFYGVTEKGEIATFSRGGSDLSGAILAEALDAREYENWTDVDGIFSANPGVVDAPEQIPALTYKEMRELSYIGFNVFHEEAVKPVLKKKIPIRLRNTNNTANTGTLIVSERLPGERDVVGIASSGGYCSFTLQKFLMNREYGFGRRLLAIFEELGLSYEHCPSGVDSMSVILDQDQMQPETVNTIIREIEEQLNPDDIKTEFGLALVSVVGEGLIHKIGVLSQATGALSKAEINIKMANQGSSEISMIFGIDGSDESQAVRALYKEFFSD